MDWNVKGIGSFDLRKLDEGDVSNMETIRVDNYNNMSSRFGLVKGSSSGSSSGGEYCVDLKLGSHVANSMTVPSETKLKTSVSKTAGKRGRGMNNNGDQRAWCMVDECSSDMSNCREYHRRHKVCELHSKTPVVTIGGLNQRFCQQCSRFHSLEEFDEGKRSCRKRLDGHNRRRRKPQPVPLTRPSTLFSNYHQGRQLVPFSSDSNINTSSALVNPADCDWEWNGRAKVYHNNSNSNSSSNKQQIFLGSFESSRIKQDMTMARPAGSSSFSSPPLCALSLLSSPPPPMYLSQPLATAGALRDHSLQEVVDTTLVVSNGTQPSMYNLFGSNSHHSSLPFHWG